MNGEKRVVSMESMAWKEAWEQEIVVCVLGAACRL